MKHKIKRIGVFILGLAILAGGFIFIFRARVIMHYMPVVEQIGEIHIKVKNDTIVNFDKLFWDPATELKL